MSGNNSDLERMSLTRTDPILEFFYDQDILWWPSPKIFSTEFTFLDRFFLKRFRFRLFVLGIGIYVSFFFHALKRKIYNLGRFFWSCRYSV